MFTVVHSRFLALRPRVRAVLYMMAMVLLFAMLETIAKYLSRFYPVPMIAWGRYSVHLLLMLVLFAPRYGYAFVAHYTAGCADSTSLLAHGINAVRFQRAELSADG